MDITTKEDCKTLVEKFYEKLMIDEKINHHFVELNLEPHIQKIADFWSTILIGTQLYKNNTIQAHSHLNLTDMDYEIWLRHFNSTLDENFEGQKTEEARSRAKIIALTMKHKFNKKFI